MRLSILVVAVGLVLTACSGSPGYSGAEASPAASPTSSATTAHPSPMPTPVPTYDQKACGIVKAGDLAGVLGDSWNQEATPDLGPPGNQGQSQCTYQSTKLVKVTVSFWRGTDHYRVLRNGSFGESPVAIEGADPAFQSFTYGVSSARVYGLVLSAHGNVIQIEAVGLSPTPDQWIQIAGDAIPRM